MSAKSSPAREKHRGSRDEDRLQFYSFSWPGGPPQIGPQLARAAQAADDAGFDSLWVMDHFWQIGRPGSEVEPMLEGLTPARSTLW
jgi:alkanesulfonate monooxygenase SsuD/methylene tetrahydromethanopterin reductase-like flavin-dependent oxidoreductase (luciferase family)